MMKPKKRTKNYINNRTMYEAMREYCLLYHKNKSENIEPPQIPKYIGECLYLISTRLASKPNFNGYSYRDEMIGDAIENCIIYLHKFDPEKYNNPFAYFTQIIKFAFLRRIEREKTQQYIKMKERMHALTSEEYSDQFGGGPQKDNNDIASSFIEEFEHRLSKKKKQANIQNPSEA